eukprot:65572_1
MTNVGFTELPEQSHAMDVDDNEANTTHRHHCNDHGDHHDHHHEEEEEQDTKKDLSEFYYAEQNEISMLHQHLKSLPDFSGYEHIHTLILRQNLLINLDGLGCLTHLKYLDCYLNSFETIDDTLLQLSSLEWLDLSFNSIRVIENLDHLKQLKKLYLVNNKIKKMNGLNHMTALTMLELGSNRIRVIENIDQLTQVTQLWLGKNKIRTLQNLDALVHLKLLSIQSNRITSIKNGLKYNVNLEELYLSHNGLQSMDEGLLFLPNLKTLDLAGNFITKMENLENAKKLQELWMNDNKVDTFEGLNCITSSVIETIYLERNPIQLNDTVKYKQQLLSAFPSLIQLDALPILSRVRANKLEAQIEYKPNENETEHDQKHQSK